MESLLNMLKNMGSQLIELLVPLGIAVAILLGGWMLARVLSSIVGKILTRLQVDRLAEKLNQLEIFLKYKVVIKPVIILKKFIYWIIMLIAIMATADHLGLEQVSSLVDSFIQFLPELLKALLIFLAGIYGASLAKNLIGSACRSFGIKAWNAISSAAFFVLLIIIFISTLKQLDLETELLSNIVLLVIGGICLAFAIAYGFAARNTLASILTAFYSKNAYTVGQIIEVDGHKGTIIEMNQLTFTLDTGTTHVVFPLNRLMNDKIVVFKE